MKDVFDFRNRLVDEYSAFSRSFSRIAAADLASRVEEEYARGRYWPEPLIQINPNCKRSGTVQEMVAQGSLHPTCASLFKTGKVEGTFAKGMQRFTIFSEVSEQRAAQGRVAAPA